MKKEDKAGRVHSKDCFPFKMMIGATTDEQQLYGRIKKALVALHRAPTRKKNKDQLLVLTNEWYNNVTLWYYFI